MSRFYTNIIQWGNNLLLREIVNGERINRRVKYSPTMFCPVMRETKYKTLQGKYVMPVKHETIKEAKNWVQQYEDQPHLVYGNTNFQFSYLYEQYPNLEWNMDEVLIITIDIEVACENGFPNPQEASEELLSITIKNQQNKQIFVWGVGKFKTERKDVVYIECDNEYELLTEFIKFWKLNQPDVITGWNTEFFDIPYLCNRIKKIMNEDTLKDLSPWRSVLSKTIYQMGRQYQVYDIQGVAALDYYDLYRKFTYTNQESYKLDHIANVELGIKKDENPHDTFRDWYTNDFQSFIDYNIKDVEIVDQLEDKMKLIELCLTMAYEAKVNYVDVLGSVRYWDVLIHNYLMDKKIVIPQKTNKEKSDKYEGAYVKDPQVGEHKWVVSFDLNSLYPHLIMQYNISPETLKSDKTIPNMNVDKLLSKKVDTSILKDTTMTPNGALFRTDKKGFLPEMMQTMYEDRVKYKRAMLDAKQEYEKTKNPKLLKMISKFDNIQMARKISLNSAYGAIGNNWFRYYNLPIAEAITTSGQLSIRWIEEKLNEYMNELLKTKDVDYVIASDTDSVYIRFDELVEKFKPKNPVDFLDTIAKEKVEPFINKVYKELADYTKAFEQKMQMKREVIADKGIWTAKKRYILNAHDVEGVRYKEPKLKIMGIEAVKSSTPAPCRENIKQALRIIMDGDEKELNTFIQNFRKKFLTLAPEDVAYPRGVNGLSKWTESHNLFKKGAPIHVKGAILYNHLIKKNKLGYKYPLIQEGDKIKFLHMKLPNIYQSSSISFITKLPKEISFAVDYDLQFEKSFIEPLNYIIEKIKWNVDRSYGTQGTLESFFA
ncbi:MAG: DNA polymerase [Alphaproteobacteria bacterium TMED194]|nr:MAG: DNA polymerase [Alphaproteobacteria bacterium TMED194]|tara:strand:+ start:14692 stop:17169 length:2478 start_codon:yes stop_codon:yes gene_type:complete